ncbi:protein of unknown function (DUF4402) [Erythrobacter litoralis]|jgi:hypothetical protein|uniref:DUF4402 domain-containing protein n=1 Tax=Erythrobacter litoralis TaxID=39960 RepID=A0A074MTG5_9SPHN|nr:DUF4402 domain-containing protein [Erythrobacter litoralis]AOL24823.1 protein of unknown function (DUF4402) [Erythrobacter litoralis]KEO96799.1 hypothetical protein EH32_08950 [Erythrobacter litoralis]MEE4339836.1 DUF4402 domain-containing protein [Erythrobacter sp.]
MTRIFTRGRLALATSCAVLAAMIGGPAYAQDSTGSSDARTLVVTPLSFVKDTDLDFGQIIASGTAGTVTMDVDGNMTTTGGVTAAGGNPLPARFWGYGTFNQTLLINVDRNSYLLTREGGTETMRLDQVAIGSRPPIQIRTNPRRFRIANPDGFFAFTIVGRLRVGANQPSGIYRGEFTVTLEYE